MGNLRFLVSVGLLLCCINPFLAGQPGRAEVIPDKTGVGTKVNKPSNKPNYYDITGGKKFGPNLLHSFLQFSLSKGWTAEFSSLPDGIRNIISRVTGPDPSNIDGTLKVGGTGINLFLLNPNGIIFGPNAKLDLSGSFLASTAESIKFSGGSVFSANPTQDQLLTIGVPAGLQFGANPGRIEVDLSEGTNRSFKVKPGQTLALIGGEVNLHGNGQLDTSKNENLSNNLQAENGRIEIGSVAGGETVGILQPTGDRSLALDYADVTAFNDIRIDNALFVGDGFSDVFIYGRNIDLLSEARIGGINVSKTSPQKTFGSIFIDASTGSINLDNSAIRTASTNLDDLLKIDISAKDINLTNTSRISANTDPDNKKPATAGNIDIIAKSIRLSSGSSILSEANKQSDGKGGDITLNVEDALILQDGIIDNNQNDQRTQISVFGKKQAGNIVINAQSIFQNNFTAIFAKSQTGNGGRITLNVKDSLILRNNSKIGTSSTKDGNGGTVNITAGVVAGDSNKNLDPNKNSDIRVTADGGKAGSITIKAQGIFGLSQENGGINAFSYSDPEQNGRININRLATNSIFNFTEPPPQLQKQPLEAVCFDNQRGDQDSFVNSGRGGLPSNPSEPTVSQALWQDLRSPSLGNVSQPSPALKSSLVEPTQAQESPITPVVEAQGWVFKPDGTISLVADATATNSSEFLHNTCFAPAKPAA